MKRYTARFAGARQTEALRQALDQHLYHALSVSDLRAEANPADQLWEVEIGSESERDEVQRALLGFASRQDLRLESLRWGWLLSRTPGEVSGLVAPPLPRTYPVRWRPLALVMLVRLAAVLGLAFWFLGTRLSAPDNVWSILLLALLSGAAFGRADYPFTRVSSVRLDGDGLSVSYWLPPSRQLLSWSTLDYLKLRPVNLNCELHAGQTWAVLPLGLLGPQAVRDIVGVAVTASGLALADDLPRGGAVYRRPQAVPA